MKINCPKCKIPMRDIELLGMGPKFECNQCNLRLFQRGSEFFKLTLGVPDDDGWPRFNVEMVKI